MFSDGNIFEGALVTESRFDTIADQSSFDWVAATVSPGSTIDQANAAIDAIAAEFPQIDAQSAAEYRESISGQIDQLLQILGGFLGLAILIAFIGIVNTMALSIFERTRELGLLRAVGMTRTQMHRMVRWEAVIVSAVGALLGAAVGIVFGVLVVEATPSDILSTLAIPWMSITILVVVASAAGLVAGFLPARRAGKLERPRCDLDGLSSGDEQQFARRLSTLESILGSRRIGERMGLADAYLECARRDPCEDVARPTFQLLPRGDVVEQARPGQEQRAVLRERERRHRIDRPRRIAERGHQAAAPKQAQAGIKNRLAYTVVHNVEWPFDPGDRSDLVGEIDLGVEDHMVGAP